MRVLALLLGIILLLFGLVVGGCSITLLLAGLGEPEWVLVAIVPLLIASGSIAAAVWIFRGKVVRGEAEPDASLERED